jgi:hypothetical protein
MEDSDAEKIDQERLYQQYLVTQQKTNTSHVMQYGDLVSGIENIRKNYFFFRILVKFIMLVNFKVQQNKFINLIKIYFKHIIMIYLE